MWAMWSGVVWFTGGVWTEERQGKRSRFVPPPLPRAWYVGWVLEQNRKIWSSGTKGARDWEGMVPVAFS